jgi:hypothetical protein
MKEEGEIRRAGFFSWGCKEESAEYLFREREPTGLFFC